MQERGKSIGSTTPHQGYTGRHR